VKIKSTKKFDWHFWIPSYKIQVVVPANSYFQAVQHLKECLSYYNKPAPEFEFQFGQAAYGYKK